MRFNYTVSHVPGKALNTADTLSRLPNLKPEKKAEDLQREVEAYINLVVDHIPATEKLHLRKTMTPSASR
jgi:hypothetical protein